MGQRANILKFPQYEAALLMLLRKSPARQMALVDIPSALEKFKKAIQDGEVHEVGDYLVWFQLSPTWYSGSKVIIIEDLVLRFQRIYDNPASDVAVYLKHLNTIYGTHGVVAGDTQVGAMGKVYEEAGFTPLGKQYFWSE